MGPNREFRFLAILCVVVFISTGCAFGTRKTELLYPPQEKGTTGSAVAEAAAAPVVTDKVLSVLPFSDTRQDLIQIGCVRNGFGMQTARVEATNSVADWVTDATVMELEKAGFSVSRVENMDAQQTGPVLEGQILKVFCDSYFSYSGEVILTARVVQGESEILNKTYTGKGSAGVNWAAGSKAYGQSLSLALADAMKAMVGDVTEALKE